MNCFAIRVSLSYQSAIHEPSHQVRKTPRISLLDVAGELAFGLLGFQLTAAALAGSEVSFNAVGVANGVTGSIRRNEARTVVDAGLAADYGLLARPPSTEQHCKVEGADLSIQIKVGRMTRIEPPIAQ